MKKIVVIGDIHGRDVWNDIIDKNPDADLFVFLGDYVSSHDGIDSDAQINNLYDILLFKEENPDKVVLLRGNHDMQHLGYYWAECSGYFRGVGKEMQRSDVRERFLKDTQWVFQYNDIIFSHAGITERWFKDSGVKTVEEINTLEPSELFGFRPCKMSDYYGVSETQGPTWIRPQTLLDHTLNGYRYVIGHTPVKGVMKVEDWLRGYDIPDVDDIIKDIKTDIWMCDALPKEYLIIENEKFKPTKI